jgi:hypothetical protein
LVLGFSSDSPRGPRRQRGESENEPRTQRGPKEEAKRRKLGENMNHGMRDAKRKNKAKSDVRPGLWRSRSHNAEDTVTLLNDPGPGECRFVLPVADEESFAPYFRKCEPGNLFQKVPGKHASSLIS